MHTYLETTRTVFVVARSVSTLGTTNFFPDLVPARKSTLAPCAQGPLAFLPRREDPLLAEQHLNRNAHIPKPASVEQSPDHRGQPNAVIDPPRSDLGKMAEDGEKKTERGGERKKREEVSHTTKQKDELHRTYPWSKVWCGHGKYNGKVADRDYDEHLPIRWIPSIRGGFSLVTLRGR